MSREIADQIQLLASQVDGLGQAVISLPLAAVLGATLAFRPRRRGTPPRRAAVVQTQILLAIVGAAVMLVVGASLARAFGIVGVANLIRYRAKIDDPKDAVVMLATLSVGLASGVGLYLLAAFSTAFMLAVLWIVESFEPASTKLFTLTVHADNVGERRGAIENVLHRYQAEFEMRSATADELTYETELPLETRVDRISNTLLRAAPAGQLAVQWDEKKKK